MSSEKVKKHQGTGRRKILAECEVFFAERPCRCPRLYGTGVKRLCKESSRELINSEEWKCCDDLTGQYLHCEHFSNWFWKQMLIRHPHVKAIGEE